MDIVDFQIVRIKDQPLESDVALSDLWLAVDADSYSPVPKKIAVPTLIEHIKTETLRALLGVKDMTLRADSPTDVVFDEELSYDYDVFWKYYSGDDGQVGIEITNATSTGFTIMAIGADMHISYYIIPIIPIVPVS